MDVPVDPHWENFVETSVAEGRYASAEDVVSEGLRLVEERDEKLRALRDTIQASIARGGAHTDHEVGIAIEQALDDWEAGRAA